MWHFIVPPRVSRIIWIIPQVVFFPFFKTPLRRRHLKVRLKFEERILLLLWASSFATALTFSSCTFLQHSSLLLSLTYTYTISLFYSPSSSLFSSLSRFFLSLSLFLTLIQFHYFNLFHSLSHSLSLCFLSLSLADLQLYNYNGVLGNKCKNDVI